MEDAIFGFDFGDMQVYLIRGLRDMRCGFFVTLWLLVNVVYLSGLTFGIDLE